MPSPRCRGPRIALGLATLLAAGAAGAVGPNHPVITEVFQDAPPVGSSTGDGPVSKDPTYPHAEYIEIFLPAAADLTPSLNKDDLDLTFYEIEGDAGSSGLGTVNYRIDLPKFDVDPSNGTTAGATARPSSGAVVIGWLAYTGGNPPTGLAGTPSTRIALVNGGITSASGFAFVPINGLQFGGTTNFPVPAGTSTLNTLVNGHPFTGIIEQGSGAYLLVNRDAAGYVSLDAGGAVNLPTNSSFLGSLLDAFAANDDRNFDETLQPCGNPGGIDLATVLTCTGVFTPFVPQVKERLQGYARLYVDTVKTTESTAPDSPAADALAYRPIDTFGPLGPSPGLVHLTTSAAELELALAPAQAFDVLTGTTGHPGIRAANRGGQRNLSASAVPGAGGVPGLGYALGVPAGPVLGNTRLDPKVAVTAAAGLAHGTQETISVGVTATGQGGDPPVVNPSQSVGASYRAIDPTTGLNAAGQPFQATALAAIQGLPAPIAGTNELAATSLAGFLRANLGAAAQEDPGNGSNALTLIDPSSDLGNPLFLGPMEDEMPDDPLQYIDETVVPPGTETLVQTVLTSAERALHSTYDDSFNAGNTRVRAIRLNVPSTYTKGGTFVPTERVHYVDAAGLAGDPNSGLSDALTTRGFELAIIDTNVGPTGALEVGATDDFGLVVRADRVRAGSPIQSGQLLFLSFTGGLEGADIDTLDVPPHGNRTVVIYLDLDALDDVLGVETISFLWAVDASGTGGEPDVIEAISLAVDGQTAVPDTDHDGVYDTLDNCTLASNPSQLDVDLDGYGNACDADYNNDGLVGAPDYLTLGMAFGTATGNPLFNPEVDANGDGVIGAPDYLMFGMSFGRPPGPSGLPCAGTIPCP